MPLKLIEFRVSIIASSDAECSNNRMDEALKAAETFDKVIEWTIQRHLECYSALNGFRVEVVTEE